MSIILFILMLVLFVKFLYNSCTEKVDIDYYRNIGYKDYQIGAMTNQRLIPKTSTAEKENVNHYSSDIKSIKEDSSQENKKISVSPHIDYEDVDVEMDAPNLIKETVEEIISKATPDDDDIIRDKKDNKFIYQEAQYEKDRAKNEELCLLYSLCSQETQVREDENFFDYNISYEEYDNDYLFNYEYC